MYTIEILNKDINKENQNLILSVRFTDGNTTFERKYNFDPKIKDEEILQKIKIEVERLGLAEAQKNKINLGIVDLTGVNSAGTINTLTAEREEWITNFLRLERASKLVALGVFKETDAEYTELLNKVVATRKPGFLSYL